MAYEQRKGWFVLKKEIMFLSEQDVANLLTCEDVVEASEQVYREVGSNNVVFAKECFLSTGVKEGNRFLANPVSFPEQGVLGFKWISMYMQPEEGYPFSHGNLIVLNDIATALPVAIVGATNITAMRTAGGHAVVAAKYLSVPEPRKLAVLGGGTQGTAGVKALLKQFPSLQKVSVLRPRQPFIDAVQKAGNVSLQICDDPKTTIEDAELILMAANAYEVLIEASWLKPGTTVLGINAFRDLDPALAKTADKWVLGETEGDTRNILNNPELTQGLDLSKHAFYGDMGEIVCGKKPGRENPDEIILYTHMGMGAFDVACAHMAYKRAKGQGMGTILSL